MPLPRRPGGHSRATSRTSGLSAVDRRAVRPGLLTGGRCPSRARLRSRLRTGAGVDVAALARPARSRRGVVQHGHRPGHRHPPVAAPPAGGPGPAVWPHHELVGPADGAAAHTHGWAAVFPPDAPPAMARFGPYPWSV